VRAQFNGATYIPIALEKASNATGITGEFVQYGTGTYPEGAPRNEAGLAESFRQTKEAGDGEDAAA
jgi:hypothetical protein